MGCLFSFLSIILAGCLHCLLLGAGTRKLLKQLANSCYDVYLPGINSKALTNGTGKTNVVTHYCGP